MSDIWQEHRKFIVNLMVGGLVFLIAYLVIDGVYGSDTANYRNRIRRHKRAQVNKVQASDLREIRAERKRQMDEFNRMRAIVQRIPDAGYSLEQGKQSPDLHYSRQVDLLRRDVLELCALKNIQVDQNVGLPAKFPTSRIEKDWYLRGLDVIRQVLLLALEADQLMEGGIVRVDNMRILKRASDKKGSRKGIVELLQVSLSIVGHPRAIDFMMRDLPAAPESREKPGRFLTVMESSLNSLDRPPQAGRRGRSYSDPADRNRVRLDIKLAAVSVRQEGAP